MNSREQFRQDMESAGCLVVEVVLPGLEEPVPGVPCLPLELWDVTNHTTTPAQIERRRRSHHDTFHLPGM